MKFQVSLFIIDAQNDFMDPNGALYVKGSEEIIPNILNLINLAKLNNWDFYATMDQHQYNSDEFESNGGPFPTHCVEKTEGGAIVSQIWNACGHLSKVFPKNQLSIWSEPKFVQEMNEKLLNAPLQVAIVVGVASDFCVRAAVAGLLDRGFSVYVPLNCVKGVKEEFDPTWFDEEAKEGLLFVEPEFNPESFVVWTCYRDRWITKASCPEIAARIEDFIRERIATTKKSGAVVGISGGMDSALVTIASHYALKECDATLHGLHLPAGKVSADYDIAKQLGSEVCNFFSKLTLGTVVKVMEKAVEGQTPYKTSAESNGLNDFDRGNMVSRLRANFIHTYAAKHNLLVLGTGNMDEDFGVGYYTLFGDGAVHCSPIGALSKRMVKNMLNYYSERLAKDGFAVSAEVARRMITKEPSAGLEPGQTDFKDLGYSYEFVEVVVASAYRSNSERFARVYRYLAEFWFESDKKRTKTLKIGSKFSDLKSAAQDVLDRHKIADLKSEILHPPICDDWINLNFASDPIHNK